MDLNAKILENGDLEITFDESDREEIEEMLDSKNVQEILHEGFEHYWANGSFHPFDAGAGNPFVGLTDATCIAEDMSFDDNGNAEIVGRFWYDSEYAIRCSITEMIDEGRVVFTLAR